MILFRYLCKEMFSNLWATTLVLLVILIMNQFIHYLDDAANGRITMLAVMQVMSLQVPLLLGFLLPLGVLVGMMMALGRWYVDHEMTVMMACGISRLRLLGMALSFATIWVIVVALLMLWAEPKIQWYRSQILQKAIATASLNKMLPGRFQSIGQQDNWTFYAADIDKKDQGMFDVFLANRHETDKKGQLQWDMVTADKAYEKLDPQTGQTFLVFDQGYRTIGIPGKNNYQLAQYGRYRIQLDQPAPTLLHGVKYATTSYLLKQWPDKEAAAEFQWRLAMPLSVWLFTLLAVPLSYTQPRRGRYMALLPALLIYIIYADLLFVGRAWMEAGTVSPAVGLWWLQALLLAVGLFLTLRFINGHRSGWPAWLRMGA